MTERKPTNDKRTNRNVTKKIASGRLITVIMQHTGFSIADFCSLCLFVSLVISTVHLVVCIPYIPNRFCYRLLYSLYSYIQLFRCKCD